MEWWEKYPSRFLEETRMMERHTKAHLKILDGSQVPGNFGSGALVAWEEIITSNSGRRYRIGIVCQKNHPYAAPVARILEPEIGRHHHMFFDGRLCLHDPRIPPDQTFVLNVRNWTCSWVKRYEKGDWEEFQ